jgi:RNA polymerase primary sigma factor
MAVTERDEVAGRALLEPVDGWTTSEELLELDTGASIDVPPVQGAVAAADPRLVETEEEAWDDSEGLAARELSPGSAYSAGPAPADELATDGPAALYLREISRTSLLTAEQEVRLARELAAGKDAAARLAGGAGDPSECEALEAVIRTGEAARRRLIESNLRLVVAVARKYIGRGVAFLDLVQEGNIGLQRGVERFDWRKGFRFSTYAYWWIRQAVSRAVAEQSRTIHLPSHLIEQLTRYQRAARELNAELGREPTPDEIGRRLDVPADKVRTAFRASLEPISLETPVGDEAEATIADLIADTESPATADEAEAEVFGQALDQVLRSHLTPRQLVVLQLRYGLGEQGEHTLDEIGEQLGVSRERARQLEAEAMRKLRIAAPLLRQFLEHAG